MRILRNLSDLKMEDEITKNIIKHLSIARIELSKLIDLLCRDIVKLNNSSAEALFEVSADEISRLEKAFSDYEEKIKIRLQK